MSDRRRLLHGAAVDLARDYEAASSGRWSCRLTEDLHLQVLERGSVVAHVPVRQDLDPDDWPIEALDPQWLESTELDDAVESLARAGDEASRQCGSFWFYCPTHPETPLFVCCSVWVCSRGHDVGYVGVLGSAADDV